MAVLFCFITMLGWGSWINTMKLTKNEDWKFPLYYWDYSIGLVLTALIFGLSIGSHGEYGRSFLEDLSQASTVVLGFAFLGGVIFNLSNLLIVAATNIAGMAVAFPIAVGLALIIGVVVNYIADPIGNPYLLFFGLLCIVLAIVYNAKAYKKLPQEKAGNKAKGILLSILSGFLMGFFYRFVAESIAPNFKNPAPELLTPYSAMFVFTLGIFFSNFIFNTWFMYLPVEGKKVTYTDFFKKGNTRIHLIGILGGLIWCTAMEFNLIAADKAGFAISYGLGQGATMVSAAWGVFVWKEFDAAKRETKPLLTAMFTLFILGLFLIIISRLK
ncbi:GRP family sugar transporter [Galbibacter sp. BG1]|uniref:GRP family sugar transporter n=1 Tax=Galbibacter sp. BG1 TaxID=1170699 RepID=UPI0021024379|nr:GRP family sugar transporter [Galbibacter sp. BG1]